MTVSSELNRKQYTGNGVTTSFATSPVVFFDSSDLDVYVVTTATGAATLLTETTDYTVSGGDGSTGTVSLAGLYGAPSASQTLVIVRNVPLTQATDFVQNDASDAEVVEDALDKLTMADQQLSARLTRSFTLADSDVSGASLTVPTPEAGTLVGWNDAGNALQNYEVGDLDLFTVSTPWAAVIDDASIAAGMETMATALTADTAPAVDDLVFIRSTANTQGRKTTWQNALKVINSLTRDSIPDRTADYALTYDASATGAKRVRLDDFPLPPKFISGLVQSNNGSDATNDLDISAGMCRDATDTVNLVLTSALTKQLDAAWAVGTNAGGLDTGSIGNSDYYVWLIKRSDTGVVDVLFSLSSTAPTMPASYDYKRLIGWFKRVSNTIVAFTAYETAGGGLGLHWSAPTRDIDLSNTLTTSRRTDAVKVPLHLATKAHLSVLVNDASSAFKAAIFSPSVADASVDSNAETTNIAAVSGVASYADMWIRTSSTGTIAARANLATVDSYQVSTLGFEWDRRD